MFHEETAILQNTQLSKHMSLPSNNLSHAWHALFNNNSVRRKKRKSHLVDLLYRVRYVIQYVMQQLSWTWKKLRCECQTVLHSAERHSFTVCWRTLSASKRTLLVQGCHPKSGHYGIVHCYKLHGRFLDRTTPRSIEHQHPILFCLQIRKGLILRWVLNIWPGVWETNKITSRQPSTLLKLLELPLPIFSKLLKPTTSVQKLRDPTDNLPN